VASLLEASPSSRSNFDVHNADDMRSLPMTVSHRSPPNIGEALQQAVTLQQQGRLRDAEKIYTRVLKAVPDQFDALNLLGTIKLQRGQAGEAYRLINAALKVNPRVPDVWVNLGIILHALKRDQDALASFDKALALKPDDAGAFNYRGNVLLGLGRPADALAAFDRTLALVPRHPEAMLNRGIALAGLERHGEAVAAFDAALATSPSNPMAHYNRGLALFSLGRYADAVASYDRTLSLAPDHVKALNNRGLALQMLNRHPEALASYGRAVEIQKDYADAHFNQALALLTIGDFRHGFEKYEWRWRRSGMPGERRAALASPARGHSIGARAGHSPEQGSSARGQGRPLWLGEYPLQRKTILLQAEQGLGDTIQFARYVPLLARAGARIVLEVQQELVPLLAQLEGAASVVARGQPLPAFDVRCPLGSLPLALKTEPATIPAEIPYLTADAARIAKWRPRIDGFGPPKVAVAWSGNVRHSNDRNRSIALSQFASLWSDDRSRFVGIQRELRSEDAQRLAGEERVMHVGAELDDFADTAAVLALVDLVITVDTSVAHLAGAMGRPVWILLPFSPDWRWTLEGESSRWYPSARLFRQPSLGDWASVIERVRSALDQGVMQCR
jgi:tetratricopeptide (TPR) repeat protein